ncbi:hypothetical protein JVU11DRAFT_5846 [Chiua virens]|nr:hypothetical protein JVU11DRAFT_5846 [Chiua virens]
MTRMQIRMLMNTMTKQQSKLICSDLNSAPRIGLLIQKNKEHLKEIIDGKKHILNPLPVYDIDHTPLPPSRYMKLSGAIVLASLAFAHHHVKSSKHHVFNAVCRELLVLRGMDDLPSSPHKKRRFGYGPLLEPNVENDVKSQPIASTSSKMARSRSFTGLPTSATETPACTPSHQHGRLDNLPCSPNNQTINVILFGDAGVGKSAVINLIAQREVAKVSTDAQPCTLQTNCYEIAFDEINFRIFDTVGLDATRISSDNYVKTLIKGFKLITDLAAAGGVHLLVFVMRKGRITATMQSNYLLFREAVCQAKVPTVLVITHLEEEVQMEDWWIRNKHGIESYDIRSDGHACVTTVSDYTPGTDLKYTESQRIIRELLKDRCRKGEGFLPEVHSWITRLGKGLRLFMKGKRNTKRADVMRVLMDNCKLDQITARKLADRMELQNLCEDGGDQQDRNDEGGVETDAELRRDTLMSDIRSQFPHDLTGRVRRSDSFPFASGSCGDIYRGIFTLHEKSIQVCDNMFSMREAERV